MAEIAIAFKEVSKFYKLYREPKERLKEALHPFGKKYHKAFYALRNINFEINKGEILGIVGKNGSGKSTLLKLICGVLVPNCGSVEVNGKISALLELGAGFNPEFTGLQNIYFYATILGVSNAEIETKLADIISFAEVGDFINQPLKTYSSGMKSRLGFAVAVHINPEILILDEVLAVGDVLFKRKCYAKMEEFFKGGKTIIYVSHDANSINELCSRVLFLHDGCLLGDGDAKTMTTLYQKLLFAKDFDVEAIKQEIAGCSTKKNSAQCVNDKKTQETAKKIHKKKSADFIRGLHVRSNHVNADMATFSNVVIENSYHEIVNHLQLNETYKIKFTVTFAKDLEQVSIGAQIRTNKGVIISGVNMKNYKNETMAKVVKNDQFEAEIEFNCYLLPDTYFIVVFITDNSDNVAISYDAYIFKVKNAGFQMGGYVSLNQKLHVNKVTS